MSRYSRQNPSPRYKELLALYRQMHTEGERFLNIPPEKVFPGTSLPFHLAPIQKLIQRYNAKSILDYGSGKGTQYQYEVKLPDGSMGLTKDYWGVDSITCYDPAYQPFSTLPIGRFDAVISTDVMEHCPEQDIPWILDEMFRYAEKFVFVNIACFPAFKRLANGENAHCTVKSEHWWTQRLDSVNAKYPGVKYHALFDLGDHPPAEPKSLWGKLSRCIKERRLPDRLRLNRVRAKPHGI